MTEVTHHVDRTKSLSEQIAYAMGAEFEYIDTRIITTDLLESWRKLAFSMECTIEDAERLS